MIHPFRVKVTTDPSNFEFATEFIRIVISHPRLGQDLVVTAFMPNEQDEGRPVIEVTDKPLTDATRNSYLSLTETHMRLER